MSSASSTSNCPWEIATGFERVSPSFSSKINPTPPHSHPTSPWLFPQKVCRVRDPNLVGLGSTSWSIGFFWLLTWLCFLCLFALWYFHFVSLERIDSTCVFRSLLNFGVCISIGWLLWIPNIFDSLLPAIECSHLDMLYPPFHQRHVQPSDIAFSVPLPPVSPISPLDCSPTIPHIQWPPLLMRSHQPRPISTGL